METKIREICSLFAAIWRLTDKKDPEWEIVHDLAGLGQSVAEELEEELTEGYHERNES